MNTYNDKLAFLPDAYYADRIDDEHRLLHDFAAAGAKHMVLSNKWCRRHLEMPGFLKDCMKTMLAEGLDFTSAHAPYGENWDFGGSCTELEAHKRLLETCAKLGITTYTAHLGACYNKCDIDLAISRCLHTVEKLLPYAEDANVVLAVENIYSPLTVVENLLKIVKTFESPYVGFCYDSGHANIMTRGVRDRSLCSWVTASWNKIGIIPVEEDFTPLWPYLVTCHLHNNSGADDAHRMPDDPEGNVEWNSLIKKLDSARRLISFQTETHAEVYKKKAADVCRVFFSLCDN